jgi:hypothetical protein
MSPRRPSRLALRVFDVAVADNQPLKGDLVEEFHSGRSQWWLWRQVVGAVVRHPNIHGRRPDLIVLGAAVLLLITFEAVFVTNLMHRLLFGVRVQSIAGYLYQLPGPPSGASRGVVQTPLSWLLAGASIAASIPIGLAVARFHTHYTLSLIACAASVTACAAVNLRSLLLVQFLTTMLFVVGLLTGGWRSSRSATLL